MKMWKKILTSAFATVMIFLLSVEPVLASQPSDPTFPGSTGNIETGVKRGEETTYTITLYSGNSKFKDEETVKASIRGITLTEDNFKYSTDKITISGLKVSGTFAFSVTAQEIVNVKTSQDTTVNGVAVKGETYWIKGFVPSGQSEESGLPILTVTNEGICDVDYVIAYGIEGNQVSYTVKYQDTNGRTLASDDIFFANIGDKPIVAYKNIPGYAPVVKAYTQTIDQEGLSFTFVYDKVPTQSTKEVVTEETEYNYVTVGGETIIVNGGGAAGGTASNVTGDGNAAGANAGGDDTTGEGTTGEAAIPGIDESQIVDLDDEETPLANIEVEPDEEVAGSSVGVYVGLGLLAVIIAAVVAYIVSKKRKIQE